MASFVVHLTPSHSEQLEYREPNFTLHPCRPSLEPRGYVDISYAGQHLWKFEKTVHNVASYCFGSNYSGAAFCLPHQLVAFLFKTILPNFRLPCRVVKPFRIRSRNTKHFYPVLRIPPRYGQLKFPNICTLTAFSRS